MTSIAYKIAHRRVLFVEEVVEEWQIDHEQAKLASDAEELVRETADLHKPVERVVALLDGSLQVDFGGEGAPTRLLALAHLVGSLLNKTLDLFPKVGRIVEDVQRLGFTVEGLGKFEEARNVLTRLREAFYKSWTLPDENTVRTAKQELKLGKRRVL
jgi:hypothetical protein